MLTAGIARTWAMRVSTARTRIVGPQRLGTGRRDSGCVVARQSRSGS
jgi:hypothetical protein